MDNGFFTDLADIERLERRPYADAVPCDSTFHLLRRAADLHHQRPALIYATSGNPEDPPLVWSFEALLDRVQRAGALFRSLGVSRDDPVAIIAPHLPATQFALWGAQLAGCAFPINFLLNPRHVGELLKAARAKVVVHLGKCREFQIEATVREAVAHAGCVEHVLEIDPDEAHPRAGSFQHRLEQCRPDAARDMSGDRTAALFHTGGTTGLPKLLRHTQANEVHTSWFASRYYQLRAGDAMLNGFPLFHVAGSFVYGLAALAVGSSIVIPTLTGMRNRQFVANIWRFAEKHRLTHLGCVPTVLSALLEVPSKGADISSVRAALTGGSPLPNELAVRFQQVHGIPVRNIFGMTECAGIVSIEPLGAERRPGSVGLRLPYSQVAAIPLERAGDDGVTTLCPPGETGVLALRGPHVSPGYLDPSRNAGVFTRDGWLISGDLGHVDAAGWIYLTGRSKDLIIRGGHNIDPALIEDAFIAHPAVSGCAAVGEPDGYAGELPVAYVTLREGARIDADTLLAEVAPAIAEPPAVPKRVVILEAMPQTAIGKIYKPALRVMTVEHKLHQLIRSRWPALKYRLECREEKGGVAATVSAQGADPAGIGELERLLGQLPLAITVSSERAQ